MREEAAATAADEPSWFARWEEELPSPEELMPLSQTLITPDLALAFDIPTPNNTNHNPTNSNSVSNPAPPPPPPLHHHLHHHHLPPPGLQSDFDSADLGSSGPGASATNGGDEPARTLKRPRLVWTPQLHKRFVDAVAHLGIKNAVPKTIMQLMSVDGLTRENVASHLQKYRLYLKRMQGLSSSSGGGAGRGSPGPMSAADAATDQLFASGPIPHHFLNGGGPGGPGHGTESYVPFVPMAALQHHQQMAAAAAAAQQQYYHQRQHHHHQLGHFGSSTAAGNGSGGVGGGFDHRFLTRATTQAGFHRFGLGGPLHSVVQPVAQAPVIAALYSDDLEERGRGGGGSRKVLTLFPTGED